MGQLIRRAEARDIPAMVRMAGDFIAASGTALPFDAAYVGASVRAHMVRSGALVLVLDADGAARGMLCAATSRSPLSPITVAEELVWWIDPECRGLSAMKMLRAYEQWARDMGCAMAGMVALAGTEAAKLYARAGFEPAESRYFKAI